MAKRSGLAIRSPRTSGLPGCSVASTSIAGGRAEAHDPRCSMPPVARSLSARSHDPTAQLSGDRGLTFVDLGIRYGLFAGIVSTLRNQASVFVLRLFLTLLFPSLVSRTSADEIDPA